jgi:UDP-glucose 4-epimerase
MRIGITGATGFIGSYLLRHFIDQGVRALRALTRTVSLDVRIGTGVVDWQQGDLQSIKVCEDFIRDLKVLIHLAHTSTPLTSNRSLPSDVSANMLPTANLLQAIKERQHKPHFVYVSSGGAVYGPSKKHRLFRETDQCLPGTSYGIQKLMAEQYLRMAAEEGWLTAVCLRVGNPYGVLLPPERMQGLIGVVVNQLVLNKPVRIFGSIDNVRDYLHLEDLSRVFDAVLTPRNAFDIFNIGSGKGYSVKEILELIERCSGRKIVRQYAASDNSFRHLPSWVVLDSSKAKRELGWEPEIELEEGLKRLWKESSPNT